jgi:hypothetical protein
MLGRLSAYGCVPFFHLFFEGPNAFSKRPDQRPNFILGIRQLQAYPIWIDPEKDRNAVILQQIADGYLMGEGAPANRFAEVIEDLRKFAVPMFRCAALGEKIGKQSRAGKGWPAD